MCKQKKTKTDVNNKLQLESNSPVIDLNSYGAYVEVLHEKIQHKDVKNIGIIATYGAGKSSLLKTYDAKYPDAKKITISLANFNSQQKQAGNQNNSEQQGRDESNSNVKDIECEIEKSILEQFLFSESKQKMPNSQMNRICLNHFWYSAIFSLSALALISMIICAVLEIKLLLPHSKGENFYWFFAWAIVSATILLFLVVYNRKLDRIAIKDIEATFCESKGSILNTFIDELLYFFRVTQTSIVIIEDLDRFNNTNLFSKLREINFLINNSKIVKQKVTFIYAVKDDLFVKEEDRAKFFEFIISLTPVLNTENAKDYLKNALENCPRDMMLPETYIAEITQFIQEMRLLKNIINDYKVYYVTLNINALSAGDKAIKLFSLMVYKNLRPQDFSKLQFSQGELADIFHHKKMQIEVYSKKVNNELQNLYNEGSEASAELNKNFDNLKNIVSGIIFHKGFRNSSGVDINNIKTFKDLNPQSYIYIYRNNYYCLTVADIETELGETLVAYENRIDNKSVLKQESINKKIESKLNERRALINYTLKEFLVNHEECFDIQDKLIRFLLVNGYIAEDYLDYIIKVGDTVISSNDREFIKDVLAKKEIEYSKKLDKPELVFMEILPERFTDKYVLNYDLVNYLFKSKYGNSKKDNIIKYLASGEDGSNKFIVSYINDGNSISLLMTNLIDKYDKLTLTVLSSNIVSDDLKIEFIKELIGKQDIELVKAQNVENIIVIYLGTLVKAIDLIATTLPKEFINVVKNLRIKLIDISCDSVNNDTAKILIEASAYQINKGNLNFILFNILSLDSKSYNCAVYSAILDCANKSIIEYCSENSLSVLNLIFALEACCEKQNAIEALLSDIKLTDENKERFISKLSNKFNYFDAIEKKLLSYALRNNKINNCWEEIIKIYGSGKVSIEEIYEFIRINIKELSAQELDDKNLIIAICNMTIYDKEESIDELDRLSKIFKSEIIVSEVSQDNVSALLVANDIIKPTEENVLACVDRVQTIAELFKKDNKLIETIQLEVFKFDFVSSLLQSACTDEIKLELMNALGDLYTPDDETAKSLDCYLLTKGLATYPFLYLKTIFECDEISEEDKLVLFNNYTGKANKTQLFALLESMSDRLVELESSEKISIGFNDISNEILNSLEHKGLVTIKPFKFVKWIYRNF